MGPSPNLSQAVNCAPRCFSSYKNSELVVSNREAVVSCQTSTHDNLWQTSFDRTEIVTTKPPPSLTSPDATLVSVMDFARHHGVTRQAVYKWEALGWLVRAGSKIALEPSSARVALFRDPADSRASRKPPAAKKALVDP